MLLITKFKLKETPTLEGKMSNTKVINYSSMRNSTTVHSGVCSGGGVFGHEGAANPVLGAVFPGVVVGAVGGHFVDWSLHGIPIE